MESSPAPRSSWFALAGRAAALAVLLAAAVLLPRRGLTEEAPGTARVDSVRDVKLPDLSGKEVALSDWRDAQALVLAWTAPGCPVAEVQAPRLVALAREQEALGVRFVGVCSDAGTPLERLVAHVEKHAVAYPILRDEAGLLARRVGAKTTTTVVLLDRHRRVRYRGALDDQYGVTGRKAAPTRQHLKEALAEVLASRPVSVEETAAPGCPISFSVAEQGPGDVTWSSGAAAVIHRKCAGCHREGEAAPFSLTAFSDAAGRRAVLREVIEQERMPPWTAAGPLGRYVDDRRLTPEEKATVLAWLDGGAPEGDPALAPTPPAPVTQDGWELGRPDAILVFPAPQGVPAEGVVPYRFVEVPTDFGEDRWVSAWEVKPGAPQVVHHVLVAAVPKGARARRGAFEPHLGFFAAMVPGGRSTRYPAGMAKKLPQGATLFFQMHYTPNGVAAQDLTRIGLHFASKPPEYEVKTAGAFPFLISIPPGDPAHEVTGMIPVPFDAKVLSFMPHMHLRGKSARYEVIDLAQPKLAPVVLFDCPRYDFNWQTPYRLKEPLLVRGGLGIMLRVVGVFDNSYGNPYNPDPTATVGWGDQTWDEMLIGYLDYIQVGPPTARKK